jgi:hypothetical protein
MPSAGLQIFGSGLRLQPNTPGVEDVGNANISGVMLADQFSTADTIGIETEPEMFGHNLTYGGGANHCIYGNSNTTGNVSSAVCYGYQCAVYTQTSVAMGASCTAGISGSGVADNVAVGKDCNAGNALASTGNCVAFGKQASSRGNSTVAFGSNVSIITNNVNYAIGCVFGYNISFNNSGHRDVFAAGAGITENTTARVNLLILGMFDLGGPAGAYPASKIKDNQIIIGNENQTEVWLGSFLLTAPPINAAFKQTASATVANTAAETTLTAPGVGSLTIPAARLVAGSTIRVRARGVIADTGTPTVRFRVKIGATTFLDFGAVAFPTLAGTHGWELEGEITVRTSGAGGTAIGNGCAWISVTGAPDLDTVNTATSALDTTTAQAVDLTVQWGTANAANTITCTNLTMEIL